MICQGIKTEQNWTWNFPEMYGSYNTGGCEVKELFSTGAVENKKGQKLAKKGLDFLKIVG